MMCDQFVGIDPHVLAQLAEVPPGLLGELVSHVNKRGWSLAQFLALAIDPEVGVHLSRVEDPSPWDFETDLYCLGEPEDLVRLGPG